MTRNEERSGLWSGLKIILMFSLAVIVIAGIFVGSMLLLVVDDTPEIIAVIAHDVNSIPLIL